MGPFVKITFLRAASIRRPFSAIMLTLLAVSPIACGGGGSSAPVATAPATTSLACMAKRGVSGYDVVLLIGQSNMSGYGAYHVPGFDKTDPRIKQWTLARTVTEAAEPLDHPQFPFNVDRIGPGLAFGRAYITDLPANRGVLLVPGAWGGTGFTTNSWNPGDSLYEQAVQRTKAALDLDPAGNCMAGILWSQGEIDAINRMSEASYRTALQAMIRAMRTRLAGSGSGDAIPFVLGQFSPDWTGPIPAPEQQAILNVINSTTASVPTTAIASTAGLTSNLTQGLNDAAIHLDAASQRIYGARFREALKAAVANGPK